MKRKKPSASVPLVEIEHVSDSPERACDLADVYCRCDELAPAIEELSRQIHLLGVIIDELVSEFQWQNNQIAEQICAAADHAESSMPESTKPLFEPTRNRRKTLFE